MNSRQRLRLAPVLSLLGFAVATSFAQNETAGPARVISLSGTLTVKKGRQPAAALRINDSVQPGDELITGENSTATIRAVDGSTVTLFPDSRVVYSERSADVREFLHLFLGSIKVYIEKLSGRPNPHQLTTPTAVIAVRGTTFSVFVDDTDSTLVAVDEGIVAVANRQIPSDEVILGAGQRTWVRPGQPPGRAEAFRGRSERADLLPARAGRAGVEQRRPMGAEAHERMDTMGGGRGMGGMSGRSGPPH